MRKGEIGAHVAQLQRQLIAAGFKIEADGWFGPTTESAVKALQQRAGLVADGIAGPKTIAALIGRERDPRLLSESDLAKAAERLGVPIAAIKAVNEVESRGRGFLDDGRPVILYERHVAYRLAAESDLAPELFWQAIPNVLNPKRGGYAGGGAEWARLATAQQVLPAAITYGACSWGQFQIMGYHWESLGYGSIETFISEMKQSEAAQLEAFCRFIEDDANLHKALKARKWAAFAERYNGQDYKANLYDVKLARAYDRHQGQDEPEQAAA